VCSQAMNLRDFATKPECLVTFVQSCIQARKNNELMSLHARYTNELMSLRAISSRRSREGCLSSAAAVLSDELRLQSRRTESTSSRRAGRTSTVSRNSRAACFLVVLFLPRR
jgi:hypothetical protein